MSRPPRNNYLLVVFDSCRYDTFVAARPRNIRRLGPLERRWSYATWTAPSHFNLLTGLMPHVSPKRVYAYSAIELTARVSLPVLNPHTILNSGFDSYKLRPSHNDFKAILREVKYSGEAPSFWSKAGWDFLHSSSILASR